MTLNDKIIHRAKQIFEILFISLFLFSLPDLNNSRALVSRVCIFNLLAFLPFVIYGFYFNKTKLGNILNPAVFFFIAFNAAQTIKNVLMLGTSYALISEAISCLGVLFILGYNFKEARYLETGLVLFIVYSFRIFDTFLFDAEFAFIHALSAILAMHWLGDICAQKNIPKINAIWSPFIALLVVAIFSTTKAVSPYNSLMQLGIMMNFMFIAFLIATRIKKIRQVELVVSALFFMGSVLAALILNEMYHRISGQGILGALNRISIDSKHLFSIHSNSIAGYFSALLCIAIAYANFLKRKIIRVGIILAIVFMSVVLLLTYSRLGIFSFMIAVSILLLLKGNNKGKSAKMTRWVLFLMLCSFAAVIFLSPAGQHLIGRLTDRYSNLQTFYSCKLSLLAVKDSPLFGYGLDNYYILSKYAKDLINAADGLVFTRPVICTPSHSLYVGIAFSFGILGLGVFIWGLFNIIVYSLKLNDFISCDRRESGLLTGIFAAFLSVIIHGILAMTYHLTILPAFFWIFIGLIVALGNVTKFNTVISCELTLRRLFLAFSALFLFCLYFVINPIIAEKFYTSASRDFSLGKFDEALQNVDRAKSFLPLNPKFFELCAEIKNAKGLTDEAIGVYGRTLALKPDYAFYYARRGQLYRQKKMRAHAFVEFEKAITLDKYGVCHREHYSDLGSLYKESGDLKNSIAQFKAALLIEPKLAYAFNWEGADYLDAILGQMYEDYLILKYNDPLAASEMLSALNDPQRCKSVNNNK